MKRTAIRRILAIVATAGFLLCPMEMYGHTENPTQQQKMVALTFDDGPHPRHTDMILDILAKYEIKATFFVIGQNAEAYPEPLQRAFKEGHEIENHSFDHKTKEKSPIELRESIEATSSVIEGLTGRRPRFFRSPCGRSTETVKTAVTSLSMRPVLWTVDSEDWMGKSSSAIVSQVLRGAKGNEVVLFHDYTCPSHHVMDALPIVIEGLREKGYRFVTVEEYFRVIDG